MKIDIDDDHAGVKVPPPIVYFGMVILGWGANKAFPADIGISVIFRYVGLGVVIFSVILVGYITGVFKKENTGIKPWSSIHKIIDYGPYAFSRNPIYVLGCGIPFGLGILLNNFWNRKEEIKEIWRDIIDG